MAAPIAKTVADMKVGDILLIGRYGVNEDAELARIAWIKATPASDFITKFVIDLLKYDENEPGGEFNYIGNPDYDKSNILQFLNSTGAKDEWFKPTHVWDTSPRAVNAWRNNGGYSAHSGFLHYFEEHELEALCGTVGLPRRADIFRSSGQQFKYFERHGIRANPSNDLVRNKYGHGYDFGSFVPYFTRDVNNNGKEVFTIDRVGSTGRQYASSASGIRPVCSVRDDAKVVARDSGVYELLYSPIVYQQQDFRTFFGI